MTCALHLKLVLTTFKLYMGLLHLTWQICLLQKKIRSFLLEPDSCGTEVSKQNSAAADIPTIDSLFMDLFVCSTCRNIHCLIRFVYFLFVSVLTVRSFFWQPHISPPAGHLYKCRFKTTSFFYIQSLVNFDLQSSSIISPRCPVKAPGYQLFHECPDQGLERWIINLDLCFVNRCVHD